MDNTNDLDFDLGLQIKSLTEDAREITGIATTPEPDRMGDIVEPLGAKFAAELPLLWQHRHDSPVGTVKFGKPTKNGIPFRASIAKIESAGALKEMVDMAWDAVKAKLVQGVSIGFRALEYSFMENGGIRFSEIEIYELSLVTIPANASARIQAFKRNKRGDRTEFGVRLLKPAPKASEKPAGGAVRLTRKG